MVDVFRFRTRNLGSWLDKWPFEGQVANAVLGDDDLVISAVALKAKSGRGFG